MPTLGPELNIDSNAIADPNGSEANATTGWTNFSANLASQNTVVNVGSWAFIAESNTVPTANARINKDIGIDWSLVVGEMYRLTFDWRHVGSGVGWQVIFNNVGSSASPTQIIDSVSTGDTTFKNISVDFTYTTDFLYIVFHENNGPNNGGVYIDNMSCKKILEGITSGLNPVQLTNIQLEGALLKEVKLA